MMQPDYQLRRRVLLRAFRRYQSADRDWQQAVARAAAWLRDPVDPHRSVIGHPGSPVRRLYERREKALTRIAVAHARLKEAQALLHERAMPRIAVRRLVLHRM